MKIFFMLPLLMFSLNSCVYHDSKKNDEIDFINCKYQAEQGDARAQFNLGCHYIEGEGTTQDYKQAFKWNTKAAEQGYAPAQFNLALMYYKGKGTPQDYKQAHKWYTKAAEQGDAPAQFKLAQLYLKGEGTTQDYKKALSGLPKH